MGIYGADISENDVFADVISAMNDCLSDDNSISAATKTVLQRFAQEVEDEDDAVYVYLAISEVQCQKGKLQAKIREKTLQLIKKRIRGLENDTKSDDDTELHISRLKEYAQIIVANRMSPSFKQLPVECKWQLGDTFAKVIEGEAAECVGLAGKYLIVRMVGKCTDGTNIYPHVYLSVSKSFRMPQTEAEISETQYIQCDVRKVFTTALLYGSDEELAASNLIFVGRFPNIRPPANETVLTGKELELSYCRIKLSRLIEKACNKYAYFVLNQDVNLI